MIKKILKGNIIIDTLRKIYYVLPNKYRKGAIAVLVLLLVNSIIELFGLASFFAILSTLLQSNAVENNKYLSFLYDFFGFTSKSLFIVSLSGIVVVIIIIKNFISILISRTQAKFSYKLSNDISISLHQYYYNKGYLFFKKYNSNILVRNISIVPIYFANQIVLSIISLLSEIIILVFIFSTIMIYDIKVILLLVVTVFPVFLLFYRIVKNSVQAINEELIDIIPKVNNNLFQSIFGFIDVKISRTEQYFYNYHKEILNKTIMLRTKVFVYNLLPTKVIEVALLIALLFIISYSLFVNGEEEYLSTILALFAIAAYRTLPSVNRIMIALMSIKGHQYVFDIVGLVKNTNQSLEFEDQVSTNMIEFNNKIEINNLSFCYFPNKEKILRDLFFTINKGEKVGIIGKSGSGKTTLVNVLLGFLKATNGKIEVDSTPINENNISAWHKLVGYVQQDVYILDASLAENIAFGIDKDKIDYAKLNKAINLASLDELVISMPSGIETMIGERGSRISGGQRQRIGIARALYKGAEILIFDEATSSLDSQTENEITEAIKSLSNENLTMLIIAHRVSTLKYCDRIIEIENGKIVSEKKYHELI